MRVIAGTAGGIRLDVPKTDIRPTMDRVKAAIFSSLGARVIGARVLDLFAGSGALTFEALSRGAALGVAVDHHAEIVRKLSDTAMALGTTALETHCSDARSFLAREKRTFDVIFLDPPFGSNDWDLLLPAAAARLSADGMLYVEAPATVDAPSGMEVWRSDRAGQVHYHLLRRTKEVRPHASP